MRFSVLLAPALLLAAAEFGVTANAPTFANESLHYTINWPTGLSLGDAQLHAARLKSGDGPERMALEFTVEAAMPGFQVLDHYKSEATAAFCSAEFNKNVSHGKKKTQEKTTFDADKGTATRETEGGGKTELKSSSCGRDALAYLYFVRRELSQGRLPQTETVFFGAAYRLRLEFAGTQTIRLGDTRVEADRLNASVKGPTADLNFEIYFLKDAARTPALVRVPLALGTFAMELVR
jgi:uncharacterized protein DUF3108